MSPHRGRAFALLLLAAGIWGGSFVVTKGLLDRLDPFTIMLCRFALAFAVLAPFAHRAGLRSRHLIEPRFVALGATGMVAHLGLEVIGLRFTTAATAALIVASTPALTALVAYLMDGSRITRRQTFGIALSVAGVVAVTGARPEGSTAAWLGNALVLAGVVMWGVYTVQARRAAAGVPAAVATGAAMGAAVVMTLPLAAGEIVAGGGVPGLVDVAGIAYLGLGASAAAFLAWNAALSHVDTATAAPFVNLVPVVGLILGVMLGDWPTPVQLAGGAVVGTGVLLSSVQTQSYVLRARGAPV